MAVSNGKAVKERPAMAADRCRRQDLLRAYRTMVLSRKLDDKEIQLKNQSLIFFQISGAGHEAVLTAAGMVLKPAHDWFYPVLPRPGALPDARHDAARDAAGGRRRQGRSGLRRPADAVALGPRAPQHRLAVEPDRHAVPARDRRRRSGTDLRARSRRSKDASSTFTRDEIAYVSHRRRRDERRRVLGIAQLRLHAQAAGRLSWSKTTATRSRCPVEVQTPGGDISKLVSIVSRPPGPEHRRHRLPRELHAPCARRSSYARARKGPALVHAKVIRPYSHSLSDDERLYKTAEERAAEATRDPIARLASSCSRRKASRPTASSRQIRREVDARGQRRGRHGDRRRKAVARYGGRLYVFSPDVDPTSSGVRARRRARRQARHDGRGHQPHAEGRDGARTRASSSSARTSRTAAARARCETVSGKGGVFKVTHGLQRAFGSARVFNSPLAEANIIGRAIGMAVARHQAGRRDPVLRLHLAGDDADARRDDDDALSLEQHVLVPDGDPRARSAATCAAARRTTASRARASSRTAPASASCSRRTRRTRPACCGRRSAATTRCCSSSTSTSIARPTTRASTRDRTT